jgi:hypothetical protein
MLFFLTKRGRKGKEKERGKRRKRREKGENAMRKSTKISVFFRSISGLRCHRVSKGFIINTCFQTPRPQYTPPTRN